eukprot:COSAG04_NODE_141_length_23595_cov_4.393003_7_plen_270_part_00
MAPLDVGFGRGEWPPEGSRGPIFEPYTLDTEALHRDGYAILPSIMLPETRRRWKAACQAVQVINDRLLLETDWSAVDWPAVGLEQPAERVSPADLQASLGGCQLPAPPGVKAAAFSHYLHRDVPGLAFGWGGFPEAHSVEHSGFFQYVAAHPDMLRLHSALLGVPATELRFDHGESTRLFPSSVRAGALGGQLDERMVVRTGLILNRKPGFRGQSWHSHSYMHEGSPTPELYESPELGRSLVRTLCYPDGYAAEGAGGLGTVRSHDLAC